jgi:beta-lactamase regulating signal transducer with metallopeptidase domain
MIQLLESYGLSPLSIGGTFLLQSSVLIGLGILVARMIRARGPVLVSYVYALIWVAVLLIVPLHLRVRDSARPTIAIPGVVAYRSVGSFVRPSQSPTIAAKVLPPISGVPDPAPAPSKSADISLDDVLFLVWLAGSAGCLAYLVLAHRQLLRLRRRSSPVLEGPAIIARRQAAARIGAKEVEVRETPLVSGPVLAGALRPVIYLPEGFDRMSADLLETTMLHELSHAKAFDCAWMVARRTLCAVFWFQPLLWVLNRLCVQTAEERADRSVLEAGTAPELYAGQLLCLAEARRKRQPMLGVAASVVGPKSAVGQRIELILLESQRVLRTLSRRVRLGAFGAAAACLVGAACLLGVTRDSSPIVGSGSGPNWPDRHIKTWRLPDNDPSHFSLARQEGWSIEPVRYVDPGPGRVVDGQGGTITVPELSNEDQQVFAEMEGAPNVFGAATGHDEETLKLKKLVAKHPNNPYAEYRLAIKMRQSGDLSGYKRLYLKALREAPALLAGRVVDVSGRPLGNGVQMSLGLQIESAASPSTMHTWSSSIYTDDDGCIYLPVPTGQLNGMSWGYVSNGRSGGIRRNSLLSQISPSGRLLVMGPKVHVVPPFVERPQMTGEGLLAQPSSLDRPIVVAADRLVLDWKPYPGAAYYYAHLDAQYQRGDTTWTHQEELPDTVAKTTTTHLEIPLSSAWPAFSRDLVYGVTVTAVPGGLEPGNQQLLSETEQRFVRVQRAIGPLDLTLDNVNRLLPSGFEVVEMTRHRSGEVTLLLANHLDDEQALAGVVRLREAFAYFRGFGRPVEDTTASSLGSGRSLFSSCIYRFKPSSDWRMNPFGPF